MDRIWKIITPDPKNVADVRKILKCDRVTATILANRNLISKDDLLVFFEKSFRGLSKPFCLKDIDLAVTRIIRAVFSREKILVFGDYDVDGITATAVLYEFLTYIGADVSWYIPHRIKEGYGLKSFHIEDTAVLNNIQLIITVDCGSASHEAVEAANAKGIDVVVTDHHTISGDLPDAVAVVNPKRHDCPSGLDYLAGVGVAFYLVIALRMRLRDQNFWINRSEPNLKNMCDLVALGTISDLVPLVGENRILVKQGLWVIQNGYRIGVHALSKACGITGSVISSEDISFKFAPRLNAAGRMHHGETALKLLTTDNRDAAEKIAINLCRMNQNRQIMEKEIMADIDRYLADYPDYVQENMTIVMSNQHWHEGLLGIVASKLADRYHRPVVLISNNNGIGKGSARSIPGFNLYQALKLCSEVFEDFGGHHMAAGLTIKTENIDRFRKHFENITKSRIKPQDAIPTHLIDYELDFQFISNRLLDELERLQPYGSFNREPLFMATNIYVHSSRIVGKNHLQMRLGQEKGTTLNAVYFNAPPDYFHLKRFERIAFRLQWNRYNGGKSIQAVIVDVEE